MSISAYLLERLRSPVFQTAREWDASTPAHVTRLEGRRHERLAEARELVTRHGLALEDFKSILVGIRNPYELEISRYAYLQAGNPHDRGPAQRLAMEQDFETFAVESPFYGLEAAALEEYFVLDGRIPANLRVIRYERLPEDLFDALRACGVAGGELPWVNRSRHDDWRLYYTLAAEQAVYERYRWVFEQGWYERFDPAAAPAVDPRQLGHRIPIAGAARQVGSSTGLSEGWVLPRLEFHVRPECDIGSLLITGWRPPAWGELLPLTVSCNSSAPISTQLHTPWFQWHVEVDLRAGEPTRVSIESPAAVVPSARGEHHDDRALVFALQRIEFIAAGQQILGEAAA